MQTLQTQTEPITFELEKIFDNVIIIEMYKETLNKQFGTFRLGDLEFKAAEILEKIDPVSFEYGLENYKNDIYNF